MGFRVDGCTRHLGSKAVTEQPVRTLPEEFTACHVLLLFAVHVPCATPLSVADWTARVVGVVRVGIQRDSRIVSESECEGTTYVAVVGAIACLHIAEVALPVCLFQLHVHHILLVLCLSSEECRQVGCAVVHLDVFYRVVRQIAEHHLIVSTEELATVEHQVIHLFAIDEDFSVRLQLCAWQFAHKVVEHRTLRQVESGGIIDDGVAPLHHLDSRRTDDDLVQRMLFPRLPFHQDNRQVYLSVATDVLQLVWQIGRLELRMRHPYNQLLRHTGHVAFHPHGVAVECHSHQRIFDNGAVGTHQRHRHIGYRLASEGIFDLARQRNTLTPR